MAMSCGSPLFIQAANALAVLSTVEPLGEMAGDCCGQRVFSPENGLDLAINDIVRIHRVELKIPGESILSVEFALAGDPRALTIAAPPGHVDAPLFRSRVDGLPGRPVGHKSYESWCRGFSREPVLCPCCKEAAVRRRANPAAHPVAAIFRHAIGNGLPLRCTLKGDACGLTSAIMPGMLDFEDGGINLMGNDGTTQLGIDPGICHSLMVEPLTLDGERHSVLRLFDSLGHQRLELSTPGWHACPVWVAICRSSHSASVQS